MARHYSRLVLLVSMLATAWGIGRSQVATGAPPFGSFSGGPDAVNNANLNVHWEFPVLNKAGSGLPFHYSLTYDSSVWYPVGSSGSQVWTSVPNSGWGVTTNALTGYVVYDSTTAECYWPQGPQGKYYYWTIYYGWNYFDPQGVMHTFSIQPVSTWNSSIPCGSGGATSASGTTVDGSGYTISVTNSPSAVVSSVPGDTIEAPLYSQSGQPVNGLSGSVANPNGKQISTNGATFTDSLGLTALTVSGSGNPSSPVTLTYTGPSGNTSVSIKYLSYNIKTNFGCSGVTEYSASNVSLVSEIDLPDGTKYSFTYEPTVGNSGYVTGRIASVTLPTGGTITYTYAGSNNGMTCADGSTATLKRYTPDTGSNYWQYAHTENGNGWTTTLTDPLLNQTLFNFQGIYETQRQVYQGSIGGTPLLNLVTCYNNSPAPCTNASDSTAVTLPITQRAVLTSFNGGSSAQVVQTYDSTYSLPLETDEYDFGGSTPVRKTVVAYNYNTSCGVTNTNVVERPCTVQGKDARNNVKAQTTNTYDANGNLLTEAHSNTGFSPSSISRSFSYLSGVLQTATDFNGNQTSYTNNGCNSSFPTTITPPSPFSFNRALTYDSGCNGVVVMSATDENKQTINFKYNDPNFWRLTEVDYPDRGQTTYSYTDSPNSFSVQTSVLVSSGVNHQTTQQLDGLGRVIHSQDISAGTTVDTTYDSLGRVSSVSNPHFSTSSPSDGVTYYSYDAMGRPADVGAAHAVKYPDGNYSSITYAGNCATSTDPQSKARKTCVDGLGRTTSVYEDPSGLNYQTTYSYDVLNNLTGVTQGSQTRTYTYDMLSRLASATTPESGTTSYTYDANGNALTRTDARSITTTYSYDALNRLTSKTYNDNPRTPTAYFNYDESTYLGTPLSNTAGRLSSTATGSKSSPQTATVYSYDLMGRVLNFWQCEPDNCASPPWWDTIYTYDLAGDITSWKHPAGFTIYNGFNAAQQVTSITNSWNDATHPGTLATMTYGPFGALNTLVNGCAGSGCTQVQETYDYNNRLQPVQIQLGTPSNNAADYCLVYNYYSGSNPSSCAVPPQGTLNNGNAMGYWYQDDVNASFSHAASYAYDSLNRLATAVATGSSTYNLTFGSDRYGNLTCQTNGQTNGYCGNYSFNSANNQISTSGFSYDAAGNVTSNAAVAPAQTYQWDAEGRVASVNGGSVWSFTYNAMGHRVQWTNPGGHQDALFDPEGTWLGMPGAWTSVRYLGHGVVYAGGDTWFMHVNNLGSVTMVTSHAGAVLQDMAFYPWGDVWLQQGSTGYSFAGIPYYDGTTNTSITTARFYPNNVGHWLSPDPLGGDITNPQSLNRYAYVMNHPTSLVDPSGMCAQGQPNCPPNGIKPSCTNMDCVFTTYKNTICYIGGLMGPCPSGMSNFSFNLGTEVNQVDIFDANKGAPGTYIIPGGQMQCDASGRCSTGTGSFGFDEGAWMQAEAFIDYQNSLKPNSAPTTGYGTIMLYTGGESAANGTFNGQLSPMQGTNFLATIYGKSFLVPGTLNEYTWPTSVGVIPGPGGQIDIQSQTYLSLYRLDLNTFNIVK